MENIQQHGLINCEILNARHLMFQQKFSIKITD